MKLLRYGPKGREKPGMLDKDGVDPRPVRRHLRHRPRDARLGRSRAAEEGRSGEPAQGAAAAAHRLADRRRSATSSPSASTTPTTPARPARRSRPSRSSSTRRRAACPAPTTTSSSRRVRRRPTGRSSSPSSSARAAATSTRPRRCRTSPATPSATTCPSASSSIERGGQWTKGKGCPTFGPLGPWLVTPDEIKDVQDLDMFLDVNGKRMQTGNTKHDDLRRRLSGQLSAAASCALEPGDVITTGTPPGVGAGMKPPKFLKPGDTVRLGIAGLGEQEQKVVAYKA